jgi:hypothetical protein
VIRFPRVPSCLLNSRESASFLCHYEISSGENSSRFGDFQFQERQHTFLWQPALSELPKRENAGLARKANAEAAAGTTLRRHVYSSPGTAPTPQELRRLLHGNQKAGFRKSATTAG